MGPHGGTFAFSQRYLTRMRDGRQVPCGAFVRVCKPNFKIKENDMELRKTHFAALALAGIVAATAATPSFADSRWGYAAGGFAAGVVVGSAAAGTFYDPGPYAYEPYAYAPAPGYMAYGYAPGVSTTIVTRPRVYSYSYRPNRSPNFDPENGDDFDPRIGGSYKMNASGDD
jgi:hypothetical protein